MTSIFGHRPMIPSSTLPALPRLAIGQRIEATVVGPTRQGVAVLIGQEKFKLDVPPRLAEAGTLILQSTSPPSADSQRVQIVASDGRPLAKPILANLKPASDAPSSTTSAIVTSGPIKVTAQPLAHDGKASGATVVLHLKPGPPDVGGMATPERSPPIGGATPTSTPDVRAQTARTAGPEAGSRSPPQPQAGTPAPQVGADQIRDRGGGRLASGPVPADEGVPKSVARVTGSPAVSVVPNTTPPTTATGSVAGLPHATGASSEGRASAVLSSPAPAAGALLDRSKGASLVSGHRGEGEVGTANTRNLTVPRETPRSNDLQPGIDRARPLVATVIERTDAGKTVLKADGQHFRVDQPIDLPLGTSLQVVFASTLGTSDSRGDIKNPGTQLARLIEILDDIDRAGRQAAEADLPSRSRQLPLPDRLLASKFLGLLNAENGRHLPQALSPSSSDHGGPTMVQREQIQTLVRELGTMASEPLSEGWKSLTLPFGSDQAHAVSFYFREQAFDPEDGTDDEEANSSETRRAVFDVSFSRLGRCQIDALCQDRRFDLLIRNERPLSPEHRQEIATLFSSTCEIAGMSGEIGFKVGGFFEPARSSHAARDLRT